MIFGSPWFLVGGLAALIPVIIHLVFRRKARRVRFPSLMLLKLIQRKVTRYHRLREIILLALRITAMALLALALAQPLIPGFGHHGAAAVMFVIDDSLSMGQVHGGQSLFEAGREFAMAVTDGLGSKAVCGFVLTSMRDGGIMPPTPDPIIATLAPRLGFSGSRLAVEYSIVFPGSTASTPNCSVTNRLSARIEIG